MNDTEKFLDDELAARFDTFSGYRLVNFGEVGLPLYRITALTLVQEAKELSPIEEFILKAIDLGVDSEGQIANLLGLPEKVVLQTLAQLFTEMGLIRSTPIDQASSNLKLTDKGEKVVREARSIRPKETAYSFNYDGLVRKPVFYGEIPLWSPRELKEAGVTLLQSIPAKPPEISDIDLTHLREYLDLSMPHTGTRIDSIVKIRGLVKRQRLYIKALALSYRSETESNPMVKFVIDGRMSEQHNQAFLKVNGIDRYKVFAKLKDPNAFTNEAVEHAQKEADSLLSRGKVLSKIKQDLGLKSKSERQTKKQDEDGLEQDEKSRGTDREDPIEHLSVYDHPPILREAIRSAQERLMIISPWIRAKVVDRKFISEIESLLRKDVVVYIGYGLGEDRGRSHRDRESLARLRKLSEEFSNLHLKELGNTHAKILLKDQDFVVISSFNWLSFAGDRNRTFREEWGVKVSISAKVDNQFERLKRNFS